MDRRLNKAGEGRQIFSFQGCLGRLGGQILRLLHNSLLMVYQNVMMTSVAKNCNYWTKNKVINTAYDVVYFNQRTQAFTCVGVVKILLTTDWDGGSTL